MFLFPLPSGLKAFVTVTETSNNMFYVICGYRCWRGATIKLKMKRNSTVSRNHSFCRGAAYSRGEGNKGQFRFPPFMSQLIPDLDILQKLWFNHKISKNLSVPNIYSPNIQQSGLNTCKEMGDLHYFCAVLPEV